MLGRMKRLEELPYRFWPKDSLPDGVEVPSKFGNLKADKFKPLYTKTVNPHLKAAGFKCTGATARRLDERIWCMVWYGTGKYGGTGEVVIAAHLPGLPSRGELAITAGELTYSHAIFMRPLELAPGVHMFDLGRDADEGLETARLVAEAWTDQGPPYLETLARAEATLLAVEVDGWVAQMTEVYQALSLYIVEHHVAPGNLPKEAAAQLLARVNARAGNTAKARAFAELGLAEIVTRFAAYPHAYQTWKLRFEKLIAGDLTFVLDVADRAEVDRRVAMTMTTGA
jgi:hypothetical protein